jgi:hypothetical protein
MYVLWVEGHFILTWCNFQQVINELQIVQERTVRNRVSLMLTIVLTFAFVPVDGSTNRSSIEAQCREYVRILL